MRWTLQLGLLVTLLIGVTAMAVPIKPDLKKILEQQQERPVHFEPARAGWNGAEVTPASGTTRNPVYEAYGPASTVRVIRTTLIAAATPDPLSIFAIGILILCWRYVRRQRIEREQAKIVLMGALDAAEATRAA
jgi:hypothetical protein